MGYPCWVRVMWVTRVECRVAWVVRGLQYLEPDYGKFNHILKLSPSSKPIKISPRFSLNFTIHGSHSHASHHRVSLHQSLRLYPSLLGTWVAWSYDMQGL